MADPSGLSQEASEPNIQERQISSLTQKSGVFPPEKELRRSSNVLPDS